MDEYVNNEDNMPKGHIKLKEGIDINSLLEGKCDTFEINFESAAANDEDQDEIELDKEDDETVIELTGACLGLDSDDENEIEVDSSTPFEKLAIKMKNVTECGKIKKKIKKEGVGQMPPQNSLVSIKYSNYLEYNDAPTDTVFMKKPYQFRLGNAGIYGLNIAVQSMKVNEVAWFLIHPDYAFGRMGHPPRIPPNATFLFHIELLRFVDSGPALELNEMSNEDKRKFPNAYKSALGLLESAKEHFNRNIKLATREYNKAMTLLEECNLSNIEEQEQQQKLLLKIYSNLAVCYNKENLPKKACIMCNNIFGMVRNTSLPIPAKIYFQNGRALIMLGEYQRAKEKLLKAQKLEPNNVEISEELKKVTTKINEEYNRERTFAKAFMQAKETVLNDEPTQSSTKEDDDEFGNLMHKQCQILKESKNNSDIKLPYGLTQKERNTAKLEAERAGLKFREVELNDDDEDKAGQIIYIISKA